MRFSSPLLLLLIPAILLMLLVRRKLLSRIEGTFRFSSAMLLEGIGSSWRVRYSRRLVYLRGISLVLMVLAMARPQKPIGETKVFVEGIDIVLAVDSSGSMRAMDFELSGRKVDRLEVVKKVVSEFIEKRPGDRIGLVAFSALAFTVCPLTLDHGWVEKNLERVKTGIIKDGTAIGSAITASLNRLKDTKTKDKIIILLTDGRNNAGKISPMTAAEAAKAMNVRVYTIGVGTKGRVPYPVPDMYGNVVLRPVEIEIDEELLKKIAEVTGAKYYRATDTRSLENIYAEIDKLEKTPMEEIGYNRYEELFGLFLIPGLALLLLEILLSNTVLRRLP
jgi:Ca-activated chloride channel family protein